jgi:hypothetical protein
VEIIKSREAFELGLTRYFTGKPCLKGHISERMISNGSCVECLKRATAYKRTKEWRKNNPGARTIEAQKYRKKHPEKVAARSKKWREKNIDFIRIKDRENKKRLRVTNPEKEKERLKKWKERRDIQRVSTAGRQKPDLCEVCNELHIRIVFDHCHGSGLFRGWLCDRCNRVLGLLKDDIILFRKLANYLEIFNEQINNQGKEQATQD